ncbi:MAG: glycosyltransferase family 9 protein, partial [Rhodanobacteraceae bacterium]
RHMRSAHYDLAIDPDPQSQSGRLLALLARKTRSLGFSDPHKSGTMTHAVGTMGMPKHHAMQPVFLLRSALGGCAKDAPYPCLDIRLSASEGQRGRHALDGVLAGRPSSVHGCVGLFADASGAKRFDGAWWNRFLRVFEPGVTDYALIEVLSGAGHSLLDNRYPCFYSGHVRKLASVLANLSFFISADCGVMHLGSAVGVPTAGVFKVTEPAEWGPYGNSNFAIDARSLTAEATAAKVLSLFRATAARRPPGSTERRATPADE